MAFSGWPVEAVEFYEGLQADNSTVYWQDHRAVYERDVRGPMEQLLAELADEFGAGKLFRPYRDVRFSATAPPSLARSPGPNSPRSSRPCRRPVTRPWPTRC
jgi:uncharacterized protein (DUF2461 family)